MLNAELCKKFKITDVERFLVDYVDELDEKLEVEMNEFQKNELLKEKEVVNTSRDRYSNIKRKQKYEISD